MANTIEKVGFIGLGSMGGDQAPLTPAESISGMLEVIGSAKPETRNGAFLDYKGETLLW